MKEKPVLEPSNEPLWEKAKAHILEGGTLGEVQEKYFITKHNKAQLLYDAVFPFLGEQYGYF